MYLYELRDLGNNGFVVQYGITGFKLSSVAAGFSPDEIPAGWNGELTLDAFPDIVNKETGELGHYKGNETFYINDPQVGVLIIEAKAPSYTRLVVLCACLCVCGCASGTGLAQEPRGLERGLSRSNLQGLAVRFYCVGQTSN